MVGWEGKSNSPSHMLGAHVKATDLTDLWNSIQTRNKIHKQSISVLGHGATNSTTIDSNTPLMSTLTSPIMEHHIEVSQPEGSSMVTVKELLEDPHIQSGMMQSALSAVTSFFTPNKATQPPEW